LALLIREFIRPGCPKILLEREQPLPSYALYRLREAKLTAFIFVAPEKMR
jgi:hypothetical protein